ncbi:SGNH/GDSL hydrolase family protein [Goodfellowiella coeruleoviolacea]|uniref:Acyl-CoA thioesterase-1 n=1 Tax=Goodfellowiella coeruleoviolacea TaxID=334858 RepID=A0AAE3KHE7_9PSEU|nr:SGNH/GDSL hydrolase family protein [Goodfellowiella coeruleoviolacea]MCP2168216.1 acyl-CoA thioesterase-1 [Goodfellowiella coeruleoviolacea]
MTRTRARLGLAAVVLAMLTGLVAIQPSAASASSDVSPDASAGVSAGVSSTASAEEVTAASGPTWCTDKSRLVVLGDSAATGYGTTGYPADVQTYVPTENGWVAKMARNLAGFGTEVTNLAHNGALVADYLPGGRWADTTSAVAQIQQLQPSMVIVELGGNDFYIDRDPEVFARQLRQLVDSIKAAAPSSSIFLVKIWEIGQRESPRAVHTWSEYGAKMHEVAVATGAGLSDLAQYLPSPNNDTAGLYLPDRIHLNNAGNLVVHGALYTWMISC